jgi:GNAT superfamily N-acetyltransferase
LWDEASQILQLALAESIVALVDGCIIASAFVRVHESPGEPYSRELYSVQVLPSFRGRGIGRTIAARALARSEGSWWATGLTRGGAHLLVSLGFAPTNELSDSLDQPIWRRE